MSSFPSPSHKKSSRIHNSDWHPEPTKSLPLNAARQALVNDILALYSCEPTVDRIKRYTPDCVYDDQFVFVNDRYRMAGQWFALPKLFRESRTVAYQVVRSDEEVIQVRNKQSWTFQNLPQKSATISSLITLSLDPETVSSDFIRVKHHKDQANEQDYSHHLLSFTFKKWQAGQVAKHIMESPEIETFREDKRGGSEQLGERKYGERRDEEEHEELGFIMEDC